ncbi:MAG TPA: hypothetical protein DCG14_04280, partial [Phycisphaerales bacterium]|nr:hypothetical protein [Phycisphaerales bacterium]
FSVHAIHVIHVIQTISHDPARLIRDAGSCRFDPGRRSESTMMPRGFPRRRPLHPDPRPPPSSARRRLA